MSRVWTVLAHPWHECYLDALPFLAEPGDVVRTVAPADYEPATGRTEIVFGVARCPETWAKIKHAPHALPYETENMLAEGPHKAPSLEARAALRRPWLNYSRANAQAMGDIPLPPRADVSLAFWPPNRDPKIFDLLFVGSLNHRRNAILCALANRGFKIAPITTANPLFGQRLFEVADMCAALLNVHYYEPPVFESFRVAPLVGRGMRIITEDDPAGECEAYLGPETGFSAPYEKLVERVEDYFRSRPSLRSYST